jgi:hypothetical protein
MIAIDDDIVREILPELVSQLVKLYSREEFEQQEVSLPHNKYLFVHPFLQDCYSYHGRAKSQVRRECSGGNILDSSCQIAFS